LKVKHYSYLESLFAQWGVKEGDLSNGFGDCLPNQDAALREGEIENRVR